MDETGMPLEPKAVRAIFVKGEEESFVGFCSGNKSQITVVACVSVAWYCIRFGIGRILV